MLVKCTIDENGKIVSHNTPDCNISLELDEGQYLGGFTWDGESWLYDVNYTPPPKPEMEIV